MSRITGHEYTEEQTQYLRDAATNTSVSYKQMAYDFNVRFGTRLTRNSILGKCSRLGLRPVKTPSTYKQRAKPPKTQRRAPIHKARILAVRSPPPLAPEERLLRTDGGTNRAPENVARTRYTGTVDEMFDGSCANAKSFLELGRGECRWPADTNATLACGDPAKVGSYCLRHAKIAYRTMPTVSRNKRVMAGGGFLDTGD